MLFTVDAELIKKAQEGDNDVISALYEHFYLSIFRYLYYRVGDPQIAEDLTSEVFLRMLRAIPNYTLRSVSFQAWLFQIARNIAIDHYRKSKFRDHISLEESIVSHEESVDTSVQKGLDSEHLLKALTRLTDEQREVIIMRFVAGMPIAEVAQTLHKSENAIKALQRRALMVLRQILTDWEIVYG